MEDLPKQAVKEQQKDETALVLGTLLKEGDTLTKSHLADVIYEQFGLPKRFCRKSWIFSSMKHLNASFAAKN